MVCARRRVACWLQFFASCLRFALVEVFPSATHTMAVGALAALCSSLHNHLHTQQCVNTHRHTQERTRARARTHTHTHTLTHAHTHTHTHTHTPRSPRAPPQVRAGHLPAAGGLGDGERRQRAGGGRHVGGTGGEGRVQGQLLLDSPRLRGPRDGGRCADAGGWGAVRLRVGGAQGVAVCATRWWHGQSCALVRTSGGQVHH